MFSKLFTLVLLALLVIHTTAFTFSALNETSATISNDKLQAVGITPIIKRDKSGKHETTPKKPVDECTKPPVPKSNHKPGGKRRSKSEPRPPRDDCTKEQQPSKPKRTKTSKPKSSTHSSKD